jgi:ATP-binding cassette subfamily B protein
MDALIISACFLGGVYVLKAVCTYIVGYYGHVVGVRMQADMRRDLFKKYEKLPFSYFDDHKTGDLLSRLTTDLWEVSELAHHGPENVFLAVLMFIGSFAILASINLTLTLIMFAVVPFIILFTVLSRRSMRRAMKSSREQMADINSTLENSITGIRETKAYVAHHHEKCKFAATNEMFAKYRSQSMRWIGIYSAVMEFLTDLLYLVIIFIGGVFMIQGKINAADFTAFLLYINMFINPIHRFVTLFEQLQEGMSGFSRFYEIITTPDEVDEGTVEIDDIVSVVAENAGGLIFLEDNSVFVRKYFERILFVDPHCLSYADREDYTAKLVDLSYNAC